MKNKLIIVSGGMNSITLLHREKENIKLAISFNYGQKHLKEIYFAMRACKKLKIKHEVVDISSLKFHLKSSLLKLGEEISDGNCENKTMKKTVVPFRNGIILSIAVGIAESIDCKSILIANHASNYDCMKDFIDSMNFAISNGSYAKIKIEAPFTFFDKKQIGEIGKELGINYGEETWSCYKGGRIHCGKCATCIERKISLEGFDTTVYKE